MVVSRHEDDWFELTDDPLQLGDVHQWAVRPDCGAVVVFSGTVRDHAEGRTGVTSLEYEAYPEAVLAAFADVAAETRNRHPGARRIAIVHRVGAVELGETAVVVAVSSAHRGEAFDAARFVMDAVKSSAPIWKKEHWSEGSDWGTDGRSIVSPDEVAGGRR